jgi:hypothetical protein
MKTFLKVILIVMIAIIAVKLLPFTLALGFALGGAIVAAAVLGLSALAVLFCVSLALIAVLAPVWIPVLALVGAIALIKRLTRNRASV